MNYSALFRNYKKEVGSMIQYNHLGSPYSVLAFIALIPFWIFYAVNVCINYVYLFFYYGTASCCDYLEGWLKDNKKDINPITEAVLYFVCMPFIFFLRCLLSGFSLFFYILWFTMQCFGYVASLGGTRWQPFIGSVDYSDDIKVKATTNKVTGNTITLIGFILFCLTVLTFLISMIAEDYQVYSMYTYFSYIYELFIVIAVPVTFKKVIFRTTAAAAPVAVVEETEEEEVAEEEVEEEDFPEI